ncbi:MAG: long-chain-fatty-acid--CoA ligase [Pseudomonadota bacterium]
MIDLSNIGSLADITRVQAGLRGSETAIWFEGRETSYAALNARASQVANGLIAAGAQTQDRIGYLGKNTDFFYEIAFGCAKSRMAMTGVNWRLAAPELQFIISDARISVLFVGAEFYEVVAQIMHECPDLKMIVGLDHSWGAWPAYGEWRDQQNAADPMIAIDPEDDVVQLYTSGTTGLPKGVQLTHRNYLAFFADAGSLDWASYGVGEAVMNAMPLFHVAGVNTGYLTLVQGAKAVLIRDIDPGLILSLIPEQKIAYAFWVPAVIRLLLSMPNVREIDYSNLKQVFYGASPIAEAVLTAAVEVMDAKFTQLYGLTETVGGGTFLPPDAHNPAWGKLRSCGVPWPSAIVKVVDQDANEVAQGDVGEIVISADFVMKGYWNRPDATADAIKNGFFHTGDAGYFDEDGFLFIHDRIKDMIVSGGENVYPAEVENAIFGHPDVADVAVIGVPDEQWGEAVKAIVVPKPDTQPTADGIIAWSKERIAGFKTPKSVDFTDALPRNPSGKVLRKDLREPFWAGHDRRVS